MPNSNGEQAGKLTCAVKKTKTVNGIPQCCGRDHLLRDQDRDQDRKDFLEIKI